MKTKLIILLGILLFGSLSLQAQENENRHQVNLMISDGSVISIIHGFSSIFTGIDRDLRKIGEMKNNSSGVISLGYQYKLNKTFSVGAELGYMRIESKQKVEHKVTEERSTLTSETNMFNAYAKVEVNYFTNKSENFKLYGNVYGGVSHLSYDSYNLNHDSANLFGIQVNMLGLSYGNKFRVFTEFGFGFKGVASIGASINF